MAVVWVEGSRPSCRETIHRRVRKGSRVSKNSLMRNVGAGSSSQLVDGVPRIGRIQTVFLERRSNDGSCLG